MNKKCTILTLIVLLATFLTARSQDPGLLKAAFGLFNGEAQQAYENLTNLTVNEGDQGYYLKLLGEAAYQTQRYAEAEKAWLELSSKDPESEVWLNLSRISFITGKAEEGYSRLERYLNLPVRLDCRLLQADEAFAQEVGTRAWARFWSGNWYRAHEDDVAEARAQLLSDFPDEQSFLRICQLYPDYPEGYLLTARMYEKSGKTRKAVEYYSQAISKGIGLEGILQAISFLRTADLAMAEHVAQEVMKQYQYEPELWLASIQIENTRGAGQPSRQTRFLLDLGIQNRGLILSAVRQNSAENPGLALDQVNRLLDENPLDKVALNLRAGLFGQTNRTDEALTDYTQSLDVDPTQAEVWWERAELRFISGDQEGACHDWKKALQFGNRKAFNRLKENCDF